MSYTPTTWVNGTTPVNATNQNHLETQYTEANLSYNPDFFTAGFTLTGVVGSADGTTLNQLDVTAGTSYVLQSADNTVRQRKTAASVANQFLTSAINSTYYLWLNPDGTFTFDNTHTIPGSPPQTNSLPICQAATNASGNISSVTDKRTMTAAIFPGMAAGSPSALSFFNGSLLIATTTTSTVFASQQSGGAATGLVFQSWNGSMAKIVLSVGGQFGGAQSWVGATGNIAGVAGQATAGTFGVPVLSAVTKRQNVVNTSATNIATWTNNTGGNCLFRVWLQAFVGSGNTNAGTLTAQYTYTDPDGGAQTATMLLSAAPPTAFSSASVTQGAIAKALTAVGMTTSGSTVTVKYTNGAAGAISDFVTAKIEPIG